MVLDTCNYYIMIVVYTFTEKYNNFKYVYLFYHNSCPSLNIQSDSIKAKLFP